MLSLPSLQSQLLHPQARLLWKRCADAPVELAGVQAVVMGEKVYVGGGLTLGDEDIFVFQYTTTRDEWSHLPPLPVNHFAMAQFIGNLITVGGMTPDSGATGKMYRFKEESQEWEEFLKPMPTARLSLTVATTQSTIIAIGGIIGVRDGKEVRCATVEVYNSQTSHWYTADPLPSSCGEMTFVTIADTCYLLGGGDADTNPTATVLYASLTSLIQKATSPTHQSASCTSVWKTLPDTPLKVSAAASLSGSLLAVGGWKGNTSTAALVVRVFATRIGITPPVSSTLYIFLPFTNSWVKIVNGDLPQPRFGCTAVQLSSKTILVIGGIDNHVNPVKTVFMATITV